MSPSLQVMLASASTPSKARQQRLVASSIGLILLMSILSFTILKTTTKSMMIIIVLYYLVLHSLQFRLIDSSFVYSLQRPAAEMLVWVDSRCCFHRSLTCSGSTINLILLLHVQSLQFVQTYWVSTGFSEVTKKKERKNRFLAKFWWLMNVFLNKYLEFDNFQHIYIKPKSVGMIGEKDKFEKLNFRLFFGHLAEVTFSCDFACEKFATRDFTISPLYRPGIYHNNYSSKADLNID